MPYLHSVRFDETRRAFYAAMGENDVREIVRIYTHWKHDHEWCSTAYLIRNSDREGRVPLGAALDGEAIWSRGTPFMNDVSCANEVWRRQSAPEPDAKEDDEEWVGGDFRLMIALLLRFGADD